MAMRRTSAATLAMGLLVAGCSGGPPVRETHNLVYPNLPAPVRAAWEQRHLGDLIRDITERKPETGPSTWVVQYTRKGEPPAGDTHAVEYNTGGDEIDSK